MDPAIAVHELSKTFSAGGALRRRAGIEAVSRISFEVDAGERLAYIGPNGAGKSTSIKMLTGILRPTAGTATVLGVVPWLHRRELAMHIGTLFGQRSQLWYQLTPRQTYGLLARIYRLTRDRERRAVAELGELLDASDLFDQPVRSLSLGQRMRCELVCSLLHAPAVLFLDEPTIGLDLVAKARFRDLVLRINAERGTTVFLTSHDVSDIEQVAHRVVVINHGRLIYDDRVSRMRRTLLGTKVLDVRFQQPPERLELDGVSVEKLSRSGAKLVVDTSRRPIRAVLDELLDRYQVVDISVTDPPLEEIVTHIYAQPA